MWWKGKLNGEERGRERENKSAREIERECKKRYREWEIEREWKEIYI